MASQYINLPVAGGSGGGVTSLNSETGAVTLVGGTGITVTPAGQNITITATGAVNSFTTIQPDFGTAPVADSATDTLTLTSLDGTITVTGNASTDTIDLQVADLSRTTVLTNDFIGGGSPPANLTSNHSGTTSKSSIRSAASTSAHPGVWALQTGTDTNGSADLFGSDVDQVFSPVGGGSFIFETVVKLSNLSDGTDTFSTSIGMSEDPYNANTLSSNGIFFYYTHTASGGNWTFYSFAAAANSSLNTGVAVMAGTWYKLGYIINSAGTSIQAYINGIAVGSPITTNIPSTNVMLGFCLAKTAGTNNRILDIDYFKIIKNLSTPR